MSDIVAILVLFGWPFSGLAAWLVETSRAPFGAADLFFLPACVVFGPISLAAVLASQP